MHIATNNEVQDEAAELRRAMEVSLAEQQARREAEEAETRTRCRQLSAEQLQKRYGSSEVSWLLMATHHCHGSETSKDVALLLSLLVVEGLCGCGRASVMLLR